MPLNEDTKWVHSSSKDNKNPDRDLGGIASVFEISEYPMNNLFDNILPKEALAGLIDYRCFYIFNKKSETYIRNVKVVKVNEVPGGSSVTFGTRLADEIQKLVITPLELGQEPDRYGHVILDVHLGAPITVYWGTGISDFASNLQAVLQSLPMCQSCVTTPSGSGPWEVEIEFLDEAGKRSIPPIIVVANRLDSTNGGFFRVFPPGTTTPNRCPDDKSENPLSTLSIAFNPNITSLKVFPPIDPDSFEPNGIGWAFNKCLNKSTGGFQEISYTNIANATDHTVITLSGPLGYAIEEMNEVYIEPKLNDKFIVAVRKEVDGAPVNTLAEVIKNDHTPPLNVVFSSADIEIPWLMPLEGFYIWVKRTTDPMTPGKGKDGFEFTLTGDVYS